MIHSHDVVASTQDLAHSFAATGGLHGDAVLAREQTVGRGTRGRDWSSGPGGLWLSVILRPPGPPALEALSVRVGLELAEMLSDLLAGDPVQVKWPNDLVARDRKLGGILCESRWNGDLPSWAVVGVGINGRNALPVELADRAITLHELGWSGSLDDLVPIVVRSALRAADRTGPLDSDELLRFAHRDWLRGKAVAEPVAGIAIGIGPEAKLRVEQPNGKTIEVLGTVALAGLAREPGTR